MSPKKNFGKIEHPADLWMNFPSGQCSSPATRALKEKPDIRITLQVDADDIREADDKV